MVVTGDVATVLDSPSLRLAGEYAQALLDCTQDDSLADEIGCQLEAIVKILNAEQYADRFLTSLRINASQAKQFVEKTFAGRVFGQLESLLLLMARNGRLSLLGGLTRRYRQLLNVRMGKLEVTVTTAVELSESLAGDIESQLAEILSSEIIVTYRLDPDLLGGMVVQVGDRLFDGSIAANLKKLRQRLKAES